MGQKYRYFMFRLFYLIIFFLFGICAQVGAVNKQDAQALVVSHKYAEAVEAYRELVKSQPALQRDADVCKFFGQALCMNGAYEEAIPYLELGAKGNRYGAWWYLGICKQHTYDFKGAIDALEKYRAKCTTASGWVQRTDSIIAECRVGLKAVSHVQDVVIIDSIIVPKQAFFLHYKLGAESGRVLSAADCGEEFSSLATPEGLVCENQAADYRIFTAPMPGKDGWQLYESHSFSGQWEKPHPVASLGTGKGVKMGYPFLRSDGETLYFACDSTPGMGGYDIYKTHYNSENNAYYTPERLGMPFNSPYNDYMMAFDETHQVGWWATDRLGHSGQVCIYLFQDNDAPEYLEGDNPSRARIERITDTWKESDGYYTKLVSDVLNAPQYQVTKVIVHIPINDRRIYTSPDEFKSEKAKSAYMESVEVQIQIQNIETQLETMRNTWRNDPSKHNEIGPKIIELEKRLLSLDARLAKLQMDYRGYENSAK